MPRLEAASISITSMAVEAAMARQLSHRPQGVTVGLVMRSAAGSPVQLSALARILAMLVLPVPREPGEHVGVRHGAAAHGVAQGRDT